MKALAPVRFGGVWLCQESLSDVRECGCGFVVYVFVIHTRTVLHAKHIIIKWSVCCLCLRWLLNLAVQIFFLVALYFCCCCCWVSVCVYFCTSCFRFAVLRRYHICRYLNGKRPVTLSNTIARAFYPSIHSHYSRALPHMSVDLGMNNTNANASTRHWHTNILTHNTHTRTLALAHIYLAIWIPNSKREHQPLSSEHTEQTHIYRQCEHTTHQRMCINS